MWICSYRVMTSLLDLYIDQYTTNFVVYWSMDLYQVFGNRWQCHPVKIVSTTFFTCVPVLSVLNNSAILILIKILNEKYRLKIVIQCDCYWCSFSCCSFLIKEKYVWYPNATTCASNKTVFSTKILTERWKDAVQKADFMNMSLDSADIQLFFLKIFYWSGSRWKKQFVQ